MREAERCREEEQIETSYWSQHWAHTVLQVNAGCFKLLSHGVKSAKSSHPFSWDDGLMGFLSFCDYIFIWEHPFCTFSRLRDSVAMVTSSTLFSPGSHHSLAPMLDSWQPCTVLEEKKSGCKVFFLSSNASCAIFALYAHSILHHAFL